MSVTDLLAPPLVSDPTPDDAAFAPLAGGRAFSMLVVIGRPAGVVLGTGAADPVASDYDDDEDEDYFYDDDDDDQDDVDDDFDDDEDEDDDEEDEDDDEI
ncbi:MAG: hypothetical protein AAFN41_05360 [Planctomycetota bacterium]